MRAVSGTAGRKPPASRIGQKGQTCARGDPGARCTQECVGVGGLAPRISTIAIPYRDGSTKARWAMGTAAFLRKPLGDRQFRAFAVREEAGLDGRVRSSAPRVVLRSENLTPRFRI